MTTEPVTIGLVGAGFAATFHLENYRRIPGEIRIKGVASSSQEKAAAFAAEHGLDHAYESFEHLLADPEITLVDLCVPNGLHHPYTMRAAEAGKHIICEKPLTGFFSDRADASAPEMFTTAMQSADQMAAAVRAAGVIFCYAECWVYAPSIRKADSTLAQSDNTILRIVAEESHSGTHSEYAKQWRHAGGGALFHKGCHPVGGVLHLKASEGLRKYGKPVKPVSVVAQVANLTEMESFKKEEPKYLQTGWVDCEDWGSMMVTFDDGSVAQITAADTVLGGILNQMTIYSSKKVVQCNLSPNTGILTYAPEHAIMGDEYIREKVETHAGWQFVNPDEAWMNGFPHELEDFCNAVAHKREPKSGIDLAREVLRVCYGAYISAESGRRFDLPA